MTAVTSTPSRDVPGSWDIEVTGLPTYGALLTTPAGWSAFTPGATITEPSGDGYALAASKVDGRSMMLLDSDTSLTTAPSFMVARVTAGTLSGPGNPAEVDIGVSKDDFSDFRRTPTAVVTEGGDTWLNLFFEGTTDPRLTLTAQAIYPYSVQVGIKADVWVYAAGDVDHVNAPAPPGLGGTPPQTAALPIITRTDRNGTTLVPIPPATAQESLVTGTLTVTDHAAALTGDITWTVTAGTSPAAWTTAAAPGDTGPLLSRADEVVDVGLVTGYDSRRASRATLHEPIGRADPIVVTHGPASTRTGRLGILCHTYAAARALEAVLSKPGPHQLRQATLDGLDMHFTATAVDVTPDTRDPSRWTVTIDYTEAA